MVEAESLASRLNIVILARLAQLAARVLEAAARPMGDLTAPVLTHVGAFTRHFGRTHPEDFPDRILGPFVAHAKVDEAVEVAAESHRAHPLYRSGHNPAGFDRATLHQRRVLPEQPPADILPGMLMASGMGASVSGRTAAGSGNKRSITGESVVRPAA